MRSKRSPIPQVESSSVGVALGELPEHHRAAVVREALGNGNEETLRHALQSHCRSVAPRLAADDVPQPHFLMEAKSQDGFAASIGRAVARVQEGKATPPLESLMPALVDEAKRISQTATTKLAAIEPVIERVKAKLTDAVERFDLYRSAHASVAELDEKVARLVRAELVLLLTDLALALFTAASFFGVFAPGVATTLSDLVPVISVGLLLGVGGYALARLLTPLAGQYVARYGFGERLHRALAVFVAGLLIALLAASFLLRLLANDQGTTSGEHIGTLGGVALALASAVGLCGIYGVIVYVRIRIGALESEREATQQEEEFHSRAVERLRAELSEHEAAREKLERESNAGEELRRVYETGVALVLERREAERRETEEAPNRALAVFRLLMQRSLPEREEVIRQVFTLAPKDRGNSGSNLGGGGLGLALLIALLGSGIAACAPAGSITRIVICDPTGESPDDVCSGSMLGRSYADFVQQGGGPESVFLVAMPGATHGAASMLPPLRLPRGAQAERLRELRENYERLASLPVRPSPGVNASDVLGALAAVASRMSAASAADLFILSDGLQVGSGYNFERGQIPTAMTVIERQRREGTLPSLGKFRSVTWCGGHHRGLTAPRAQARTKFWAEYLADIGAAQLAIHASCADLFPAAPPFISAARQQR